MIEQIAKVCHEVNRAFCTAIGDNSQVAWEDAEQHQRDSAINGVAEHLLNPNQTAKSSHITWMNEKVNAGWVYGPVKNAVAKTHPCIVPYEELPRDQQIKDYLFEAVVRSMSK